MKVMKHALVAAAVVFALLLIVPYADAQLTTIVDYPDGSASFVVNLGAGLNAFVFLDAPGDFDLFIHTANAVGNFFTVLLDGGILGIAFWLDFRGFVGPNLLFDVWRVTTTGVPFQFVGQILL